MKLKFHSINDKYAFSVQEKGKTIFSSDRDFFLVPSIKSSYKYAWEACRDGNALINHSRYHLATLEDLVKPVIVDISAEERLISHYVDVMRSLRLRVKGARGDKEEEEKAQKEVDMVVNELEQVMEKVTEGKDKRRINKILSYVKRLQRRKHPAPPKLAFKIDPKQVDAETKRELMDRYAQKICEAIQSRHSNAFYQIEPNCGKITILEAQGDKVSPILRATVNGDLNIDGIMSTGSTLRYHTPEFYQRYWKPIVAKLGHFFIDDLSVLIDPQSSDMPDMPKDHGDFYIDGWNTSKSKPETIKLSFSNKNSTWLFSRVKQSQVTKPVSKYTEDDYQNAVVKCVDPVLKSIYNRTGEVVQVVPSIGMIELDVDFGRGLDIVRLTEDKIEIV